MRIKNGKRYIDPSLQDHIVKSTLLELNALDKRIQFICQELTITKTAIAKLCGITPIALYLWEKGMRVPNAVFYSYILKLEELAKQKYEERQNQK